MKKAFLLSMDAIVAVGLLFIIASFITTMSLTYYSPELEYQRLYYSGKDLMNVFETARFSAVADMLPPTYIADCNITSDDMNNTILDVLGYLWAQNSTKLSECAENLTREIVNRTLPRSFGYEVLIDDESLYTYGSPGSFVSRLNTIVSGYELGKPVSGYFASAFISRMSKSTSTYVYFGGYEGDGNITKLFTIPTDANVTNAYLEANIGNNFTIFVNGNNVGSFDSYNVNFTANNWTICSSFAGCSAIFSKGPNAITINFSNFYNNFIGGGYLKVTYNTSKPDTLGVYSITNNTYEDRYRFPGVTGIVNVFSGFPIPGNLNAMELHLRYRNNITVNETGLPVYLILGNTELFRLNDSGEVEVNMSNAVMQTYLNYTEISNSTLPLRLGMETFNILTGVGSSDVVLITDRSGSMGTCDVWSNESYDCVPFDCYDRCSATCDDSQSTCESICNGIWTETTPSVYVCSSETSNCCDDETTCTQCGGTYGKRERINVAKEADSEFVDTVISYQGSRVGLSAYGSDLCSYDDITYDSGYLNSQISGYSDDCGGTCICCGINKAVDLLSDGRSFNMLDNSEFTGPTLDSWNETGTVTLSGDSATEDTYAFESPANIADPDMIHISGDVYAVAYETTSDSTGWISTVAIASDGTIGPVIDTYQYDNSRGENADFIHISGDIYAIAYRGPGNDGYVMTVDIDSSGNIGSEQDDHEFYNGDIYNPSIVHVSGDVYAVAYRRDSDDDGHMYTFTINSAGTIGANIDTLEFDNSNCYMPDMMHVSGDIYAIAYRGPSSDGFVATVNIGSSGNIGSTQDTFEFETTDAAEPSIAHISGNVYAVAYRRDSDDDGWLKTFEIESNGDIASTYIDSYEFDSSNCQTPRILWMYGDYYAIAYRGNGNNGFITVVEIDQSGDITTEAVDTLEFRASSVIAPVITNVSGDVYAVAYVDDSSDDGYVTTVTMGDIDIGFYDYWYVSSDYGASGSIYQNFTIPTGTLLDGFVTLYHSTSDSAFDGTANVFCNLTYPEPADSNATEAVIWSDSWSSADNPVGPEKVEINITDYINSPSFTYTLRCGASVTDGGGTTLVAFDNVMLNFTMERYSAMLVMSDGEATMYCESFHDYTGQGATTADLIDEEWAINASCNARDNGIEVYSVAFGTGADEIVMQKIACWNCSADDWIPGEEEDNCTRSFKSNNAEDLMELYKNIAQNMGEASFEAQTVNISGDVSLMNIIYPDSYILFNYTPFNVIGYGEVSIALDSGRFGGSVESPKEGTFYIPSGSRILGAHATSYSSEYWTSFVAVNSSATGGQKVSVYNISGYGSEYTDIGDPFDVNIPVNLLVMGENNTVSIDTALTDEYPMGGSPYDRVIYYVSVEGLVGYGEVYSTLENATDDAVDRLQAKLSDFDITALEVETPYQYVSELPSLWGPSVMEIRVWS